MNGKNKCKILKEIRREIARNNGIELITSECTYQGDCSGTCPKCEAELRYIEQELDKRQRTGKAVAVAGIAAALVVTATGCKENIFDTTPEYAGGLIASSQEQDEDTAKILSSTPDVEQPLLGDIAYIPDVVPGEVPDPS